MAHLAISVPFHGSTLYIIKHQGKPYVPLKPIVEGIGMDWASQLTKLKRRFTSSIVEITTVADNGKPRTMICLALPKLAGWLNTISPNKVNPGIRNKVILCQKECDSVLHEYWAREEVITPSKVKKDGHKKITIEQQEAIEQLVTARMKPLQNENREKVQNTLWEALKSHFGCSYKEISEEQFIEALLLAAHIPLDEKYCPRESVPIPPSLLPINCEVLVRIENGVTVSTNLVPKGWYVGSVKSLLQMMEHNGVVILIDKKSQKDFVKERVMQRLN